MGTWTVVAAKGATAAAGLGASLGPAIGPGSLSGFLAGVLLSGTCFLMISGPLRARLRVALAGPPGVPRQPGGPGGRAGAPALLTPIRLTPAPPGAGRADVAVLSEAAGHDEGPFLDPGDDGPDIEAILDPEPDEYRSRHRLSGDGPAQPQPETRRSTGRHAAPPASFASRMTSFFAVRSLLTPARH
jgi:hypothetical protein